MSRYEDTEPKMSQSLISKHFMRVREKFPVARQNHGVPASRCIDVQRPQIVHNMLRIWLGNPWTEYDYIRDLGQVILANRRASYFELVIIRQCDSFHVIEHARILSRIQHPNVARIHDVYSFHDHSFLVMEHLDLAISQLSFQKHELEEWEIATVVSEVPLTFML